MKSLFISSATFALAISLASTAHAEEAADAALVNDSAELELNLADEAEAEVGEQDKDQDEDQIVFVPAGDLSTDFMLSKFGASEFPATSPAFLAGHAPEGLLTVPAQAGGVNAPSFFNATSDGIVTAKSLTSDSVGAKYGDIGAFYGNIGAFYGNIGAFWDDINPFYGNIGAFYGNIGAFYGDISPFYGNIGAFWGDISPFYGDIGAFYGDIGAFQNHVAAIGQWGQNHNASIGLVENHWSKLKYSISLTGSVSITFDGTPDRIRNSLNSTLDQARAQFGAAYTARTGNSFDVFIAELLARHGLDLANNTTAKKTLAKTAAQRAAFFLDLHDSLMQYSGIDQVDHWMGTINWTPAITQIQGEGRQTIIGIVDGSFASDADLGDNIAWSGGGTTTVNGHGAGVASLIAGAHDGQGIMGIAPHAQIATYNPFDANHQTSWDEVRSGIDQLIFNAYVGGNETGYVSIINLSLGESGWTMAQGLADIFADPSISLYHHETIYVVAAGNDGISQTANINYDFTRDASFILVGSVDPNGQISSFSNRPGTACLLDNGVCHSGNELMNRFVVAPGSMILVSDGQGGVTRASGTSFAAPLVSGAIALLHDRWSWLALYPEETAEIIFRSARDLGAPGVDPIYGWGLLDVAASQSPLDFGALQFNMHRNGVTTSVTASSLLAGGIPASWNTDGVYFTAFENIGATHRDFAIPMSALQRGNTTNVLGHGYQRMQDFVADRFANWLVSGGADKDGDGTLGISQLRSLDGETRGQWSMRIDAIQPQFTDEGLIRPVHNAATLTSPTGTMSFTMGHGQGALALNGGQAGIISDHDPRTGGVNPVLGFASGEFFAGAAYKLAPTTKISVGYSADREDWQDLAASSEFERAIQQQLGAREAQAVTVTLDQKITKGLSLNAQYTRLNESDALLGEQTGSRALLGEGAVTDALTLSANLDLGGGLSFYLSATGGATKTEDGQLLATDGRALSTAGQFSINKRGLLNARDVMRVSIGQPLRVEEGKLEFLSEEVVDRMTGETGLVSQTIGIETKRRHLAEFAYATPITGQSELGVIARYLSEGELDQDENIMIGANFGLRF